MDPIIRRIAIRRHQITDPTYRLFKMEWITDDTMLVEGSATVPFKSGPRKGKPNYVGTTTKTAVTKVERDAERILYEEETGKCWHCLGAKQIQVRWSAEKGPEFKPCGRCSGSGAAFAAMHEIES